MTKVRLLKNLKKNNEIYESVWSKFPFVHGLLFSQFFFDWIKKEAPKHQTK